MVNNEKENVEMIETESMRIWRTKDKKGFNDIVSKEDEKNSIEVDIGIIDDDGNPIKMNLIGFNRVCRKGTDKLVFAFKVKTDRDTGNLMCLVHKEHDITKEEDDKIDGLLLELKRHIGCEIQDVKEVGERINNERHLFKDKKNEK